MNIVVDASVAIKWFLAEENTADAEMLLGPEFELNAPEIAISEFGDIVLKKLRHGDVQLGEATALLEGLFRVRILFHSNKPLLRPAVERAVELGQAVNDCTYLSLAVNLDCPLVTANRKFFMTLQNTRFRSQIIWVENTVAMVRLS